MEAVGLTPGGLGGLGMPMGPLHPISHFWLVGAGHGLAWLLQSGWGHLGSELWRLGGDELLPSDIHG